MKQLLASTLVCLLAAGDSSFAQQPVQPAAPETASAATPNTLIDGTVVKLRLAETISSESARTGQQVPFEVTEDVVVQGVTIIPKGTPALATVTDAESKKRMGRGGKLDVNVDSTRLIDGEKVQLRAIKDGKGGGHVGAMTGAMVATSIVFFPAAPLFLFMKGKDITIPKGTDVTAFVQGDMHLDMARMSAPPAPGSAPTVNANAQNGVQTASLSIDSSVPAADIEIDGNFVGSTPSTISVTPGQHTVTVKKKGYTDWTRTMSISGPAIHLNADLEASPAQTTATK